MLSLKFISDVAGRNDKVSIDCIKPANAECRLTDRLLPTYEYHRPDRLHQLPKLSMETPGGSRRRTTHLTGSTGCAKQPLLWATRPSFRFYYHFHIRMPHAVTFVSTSLCLSGYHIFFATTYALKDMPLSGCNDKRWTEGCLGFRHEVKNASVTTGAPSKAFWFTPLRRTLWIRASLINPARWPWFTMVDIIEAPENKYNPESDTFVQTLWWLVQNLRSGLIHRLDRNKVTCGRG